MPKVNKKDVVGYQVDGDYLCLHCAEKRNKDVEVKFEDLILEDDFPKDEFLYCNDCQKRLDKNKNGGSGLF